MIYPNKTELINTILGHAKQSATASKRAIQKTAEATDDLIGNKIAKKITNVSKHSH